MSTRVPIKRALISVSDKTDLVPFARRLVRHRTQLISTGGTARILEKAGIDVVHVDRVTGFPEMMDGRVKTLHPKIHGGLLALRDNPDHVAAMQEHGIEPIDLVCVNLYPFEHTVAQDDVDDEQAIEQIDIGGPSMVRSAAKNHRYVAVVTDPSQYDRLINDINAHDGATSLPLRQWLAAAAFAHTATYDTVIAAWMGRRDRHITDGRTLPASLILRYTREAELRYGENPHQTGALYVDPHAKEASAGKAHQLHGKALSFCNLFDVDGALELVKEIDVAEAAAAAVIKHANPCGFAVAAELVEAFDKAYAGDPLAAFGGILAFNRPVDHGTAIRIAEISSLLDVIVAPRFDDDAQPVLEHRWPDLRLLVVGDLPAPPNRDATILGFKAITGGLLVQQRDLASFRPNKWQHVAGPKPSDQDLGQMRIAMIAVKHLKSNAVCLVRDSSLVGAGAGQMDRLASCRIAVEKAGDRARGAMAASDAFFPFRDGPDQLIAAGVRAIVEPGGSKRDAETILACEQAGVSLVFTGRRHFRH